jgi:transposase
VFLSPKEDRSLWELTKASGSPQKVKERVQVLRLSSRGWKVEKIAVYLKWSKTTVRRTLQRWLKEGEKGLWDKPRAGKPKKWQSEDIEVVEKAIKEEERSYSSRQLCQILIEKRNVKLSERHLRRILKKKLFMEKNTSLSKKEARRGSERNQEGRFGYAGMGGSRRRNLRKISG